MAEPIVKICGLRTPDDMAAALEAGAGMVGLNFHPRSPRHVDMSAAAALAAMAEGRALSVALLIDPDDPLIALIRDAVRPRMIQLHGSETPERVREVRALADAPVMKALGVAGPEDVALARAHGGAADIVLLDAKPPKDAAYPGGHGRPFDWSALAGLPEDLPFLLAGGLTPENVADAIRTVQGFGLALKGVDVASGVESAPGIKDPEKMRAFVENARKAVS